MYVIGNIPAITGFQHPWDTGRRSRRGTGEAPPPWTADPGFSYSPGNLPRSAAGFPLPYGEEAISCRLTGYPSRNNRMKEGRRTDPHMDAFGTGLFQKMNQVGNGGAADNGIIHQHQAFPADRRRKNIQFQPNAGLPLLLGGLDKGSAHITVFIENQAKGNSGFRSVTLSGRDAGVRNTGHQIRFHRLGAGKSRAGPSDGIHRRKRRLCHCPAWQNRYTQKCNGPFACLPAADWKKCRPW